MNDNDLFYELSYNMANATKKRIKGYYICSDCGEFIKAIPRKTSNCPCCNKECELILRMDDSQFKTTIAIWQSCGTYSDEKADLKKLGKESA